MCLRVLTRELICLDRLRINLSVIGTDKGYNRDFFFFLRSEQYRAMNSAATENKLEATKNG